MSDTTPPTDEKRTSWTTKVYIMITAAGDLEFPKGVFEDDATNHMSIGGIRGLNIAVASEKEINDFLYYHRMNVTHKPHRYSIKFSIPSNSNMLKSLLILQKKDIGFKIQVIDSSENWALENLIYDYCYVTNSSVEFTYDNMPYREFEIISLDEDDITFGDAQTE